MNPTPNPSPVGGPARTLAYLPIGEGPGEGYGQKIKKASTA